MGKLLEQGIASRRGIMTSHRETAYEDECKNLVLPISEDTSDNSILIPLFVPMSENESSLVINQFISLIKKRS